MALLGAVVAVGFANTLGPAWALLPFLAFLVLTLALTITDLDAFRIVDRLNLRGTLLLVGMLGIASLLDGTEAAFARGLLGAAAYFAATNLIHLVARGQGFGYGDVKLSGQLGLFTTYISWGALGWSVFVTALVGGLISLVVLGTGLAANVKARRAEDSGSSLREVMRAELPYGPAMVIGAWAAIILAGLGAFPVPS